MNAAAASLKLSYPIPPLQRNHLPYNFLTIPPLHKTISPVTYVSKRPGTSYCHNSNTYTAAAEARSETEESGDEDDDEMTSSPAAAVIGAAPPVRRTRRRYRKQYPGEKIGITEEMRFVAMKLRNSGKPKKTKRGGADSGSEEEESESKGSDSGGEIFEGDGEKEETWEPSTRGFIKYLVDSKLVFSTIERIVDQSDDVSYAYFRNTGLERSDCLLKDLLWFSERGEEIPEPSNPGVTYAKYLEELAEKTPPLFLCHFYNIYFSHIAGGQVLAKKVSEKLFEGRKLEMYTWEGEEEELLKGVRENLNMVGEHWSRDEKNKCLRETTKAFRFLGQIVRLIIL